MTLSPSLLTQPALRDNHPEPKAKQIQQKSGNWKADGKGQIQPLTALCFSQHFTSQVLSQPFNTV